MKKKRGRNSEIKMRRRKKDEVIKNKKFENVSNINKIKKQKKGNKRRWRLKILINEKKKEGKYEESKNIKTAESGNRNEIKERTKERR